MKKKSYSASKKTGAKKPPNNKAKAAPAFGKRPKPKIPALGSGMVGLGGTGAQGMIP